MEASLLTLKEIADYLKVDKFTIYRLIKRKVLPAFKVGSQWRFKKELVEKWLFQNCNIKKAPEHRRKR